MGRIGKAYLILSVNTMPEIDTMPEIGHNDRKKTLRQDLVTECQRLDTMTEKNTSSRSCYGMPEIEHNDRKRHFVKILLRNVKD